MSESEYFTLAEIDEITDHVRSRITTQPRVGFILGSGLGSLAEEVESPTVIPYGELSRWPSSTVVGHKGQLVLGKWQGQEVIFMQGRVHFYEGYSMTQVGLPVRVLHRLGVQILVVTNAAGAVNPNFTPGDVMLIVDHLNLVGMAGLTPLRGPNLDDLGPRFPDMSQAYDRALCALARQVAAEGHMLLHEGVYACLAGPSFETPADLRFLRAVGVDAVGMSTVPEVTVARHCGMRVLGLSGISNKANLDGNTLTTHKEVLEAGHVIVPKLRMLIEGVMQRI